MFDKKLLYTLISIGAVVIVAVTLDGTPGRPEGPEQIAEPGETANIANTEAPDLPREGITRRVERERTRESLYIIREHEGHIAVFWGGDAQPQIILETQVKFLPDYDREQLREGIEARSYEELTALIEDFIS